MQEIPTYTLQNLREISEEVSIKELSEIGTIVRADKNLYARDEYLMAIEILSDRIITSADRIVTKRSAEGRV